MKSFWCPRLQAASPNLEKQKALSLPTGDIVLSSASGSMTNLTELHPIRV